MTDEAAKTYRRYVQLAPFALGRGEQLGFVLVRLATIQEKSGDLRAAKTTRDEFNRHWDGTDVSKFAEAGGTHPGGTGNSQQ